MVYRYRAAPTPPAPAPVPQSAPVKKPVKTPEPERPVTYRCTRCRRTLTLDATASPSTFTRAVTRAGWALSPEVLCALHAAAAEAYSVPDYRRTHRLSRDPVASPAGPTRIPTPTPR